MTDYLKDAVLVQGDFAARMWSIAKENLSKDSKPILAVSELVSHSGALIAIDRINEPPVYGHECNYVLLAEIHRVDLYERDISLHDMINELLSRYYHGNKIFISELAYELCDEEADV